MSNQDRQGGRTPADIERKYNLGQMKSAQGDTSKQDIMINNLTKVLNQYMVDTDLRIGEIEREQEEEMPVITQS